MHKQHAFTLVELSIVLVILGLLIGGVLTGQSLIHAAELRSISVDYNKYATAAQTFRDKYFGVPGDLPTAVRYWGAQAGGTADGVDSTCQAVTAASTDSKTCNGNGDGQINAYLESFRGWQHLANAGLIEGSYTGVAGAVSNVIYPGSNVPKSKISNAGWVYKLSNTVAVGATNYFARPMGNYLFFGGKTDGDDPIIKAEDAYNIDTKMDDGKPGSGRVMAYKNVLRPDCVTTGDETTATYALTDPLAQACNLLFSAGF